MIRYILQTFFNPNYPDGSVSPRPKLRLYPYHSAGDHPQWRLAEEEGEEEEEEESLHGSLRTPPTESGDNKICMYCTHCSRRRMYTNARSSRDALQWEVGGGLGREAIRVMSGMLLLYNSRHLGLPSFDLQSSSGLTHSTSEHSAGT